MCVCLAVCWSRVDDEGQSPLLLPPWLLQGQGVRVLDGMWDEDLGARRAVLLNDEPKRTVESTSDCVSPCIDSRFLSGTSGFKAQASSPDDRLGRHAPGHMVAQAGC